MADAVKLTSGQRLAVRAAEAKEVRDYQNHRDVIALGIEKIRAQVDRMVWTGIVLGLAFTMVNVQVFAAGSADKWSLEWWAAWLLDPMVSLILLALIRAEQVTSRYQIEMGVWVRRARRFALVATYAMNCWQAWANLDWRLIILHSVPPLLVFVAAEAITQARFGITAAVAVAVHVEPDAITEPLPLLVPAVEPEPAKRSDQDILDELADDIAAGRGLPSKNSFRLSNLPMGSGRAERLLKEAADAAGQDVKELQAVRGQMPELVTS